MYILFVFFSHFLSSGQLTSKSQYFSHFQQSPGEVSFVNSPTFFTYVVTQKPKWASFSLSPQEKIVRELKKRASHGGSSSRKCVRSCSLSSESSCSAMAKDDSVSVDDRSPKGPKFILLHLSHIISNCASIDFPFYLFFQTTGSRWNSVRSFSCSASSAAASCPQRRVPPIKTTRKQKDTEQKVCNNKHHKTQHNTVACSNSTFAEAFEAFKILVLLCQTNISLYPQFSGERVTINHLLIRRIVGCLNCWCFSHKLTKSCHGKISRISTQTWVVVVWINQFW